MMQPSFGSLHIISYCIVSDDENWRACRPVLDLLPEACSWLAGWRSARTQVHLLNDLLTPEHGFCCLRYTKERLHAPSDFRLFHVLSFWTNKMKRYKSETAIKTPKQASHSRMSGTLC
jgi:hypothetical protein